MLVFLSPCRGHSMISWDKEVVNSWTFFSRDGTSAPLFVNCNEFGVLASVCVCAVFERDRGASKRVINTLKSSLFNDHLSKALIGEFETLNVARIYWAIQQKFVSSLLLTLLTLMSLERDGFMPPNASTRFTQSSLHKVLVSGDTNKSCLLYSMFPDSISQGSDNN